MSDTANLDLIVDLCLQAMAAGSSVDDCLARYPDYRAELGPVLAIARHLRSLPEAEPRPGFAEASRQRLVRRLRQEQAVPPRSWRSALTALGRRRDWARLPRSYALPASFAAVALFVVLASGGGLVYSSRGALPGQPLYPVKLMAESARLRAIQGEARQRDVRLDMAEERLEEVATLVATGGSQWAPVALERYWREVSRAASDNADRPEVQSPEASEEFSQRLYLQIVTLGGIEERLEAQGSVTEYDDDAREQALEALRAVLAGTETLLPTTEPGEEAIAPSAPSGPSVLPTATAPAVEAPTAAPEVAPTDAPVSGQPTPGGDPATATPVPSDAPASLPTATPVPPVVEPTESKHDGDSRSGERDDDEDRESRGDDKSVSSEEARDDNGDRSDEGSAHEEATRSDERGDDGAGDGGD